MLQTKIFRTTVKEEISEFEKLVKEHPPIGTNGLKILPEYILLTYENGELMSKKDKILYLISELNTLTKNEVEEVRQHADFIKLLSFIDYYTRRSDWKEYREKLTPSAKNCEMTQIKIDVIVELLKELGEEIKVIHPTIPTIPEEPIIAQKENVKHPKGKK